MNEKRDILALRARTPRTLCTIARRSRHNHSLLECKRVTCILYTCCFFVISGTCVSIVTHTQKSVTGVALVTRSIISTVIDIITRHLHTRKIRFRGATIGSARYCTLACTTLVPVFECVLFACKARELCFEREWIQRAFARKAREFKSFSSDMSE